MSSFQNDQAIAKSLAPREGCRELMKGEITDSLPDRIMRIMGSVNWWAPRWLQRLVARLGLYEGSDWTDASAPPTVAGRSPKPA